MSWEPIGADRANGDGAVIVSTSEGCGRMPSLLTITLRLDQLPSLGFLKPGGACQVLLGRGPDTGRIRLVAGTGSKFFALGRRSGAGGSISLRVRLPEGIKPAKRGPDTVEHEANVGESYLEMRLPSWAIIVDRVTVPTPAGRTSIMDRVPDPAAALRGIR